MTVVSSYFAQVGIQVDQQSIKRVDALLKNIEKRLQSFQSRVNKLTKPIEIRLDENRFKRAFEKASKSLPAIKLSKFEIERSAIASAFKAVEQRLPTLKLKTTIAAPSARAYQQAQQSVQRRTGGFSGAFAIGSGGGFGMGILGRLGPAGTAVAAAGAASLYSSSKLSDYNTINQDVQSKRQSLTSVLSGYGMQSRDNEVFEWLRSQSDKTGTNYREALPDFTGMIANGLSMGQSLEQVQDMFRGITEYGRSLSIDPQRMKRLSTSFNQMLSKGTIYSEELFGQASEAAPGIAAVFATAWQKLNKGSLTGADSLKALRKAMEDGKVVSSRILPIVSQLLQERAAPGLALKAQSSMAQQARFQNTRTDFAMQVSNSGMESGFSRIFDSLNNALERISPLAESLGKRFDSFSESLSSFITKSSEAVAIFNNYASSFKSSFSPELVAMIRSVSMGMESFGNAISNLHNHIQTILQSPLFQTIGKLIGGTIGHLANTVNSVGAGFEALSTGNVKQAGKEFLGATPAAWLPWESPAEARVREDQERREQTAQQFSKFAKPWSRVRENGVFSDRTDLQVLDIKERINALPWRVVGRSGGLPDVLLNNQPSLSLPVNADPLSKITALMELQNQQNAKAVAQPPNVTATFNQTFSIQSTEPDGVAEEIKRVLSQSIQEAMPFFPAN